MVQERTTIEIRRYTDQDLELDLKVVAAADIADAGQLAAARLLRRLRELPLLGGLKWSMSMRGVAGGPPQRFEATYRVDLALGDSDAFGELLERLRAASDEEEGAAADRVEVDDLRLRPETWDLARSAKYDNLERLRTLAESAEPAALGDALVSAAGRGHLEIVRLLLGSGVPATGPRWSRPLHAACEAGQAQVAELLIERGARPAAAEELGEQAVHAAARGGDPETLRLLLDRGAPVDAATSYITDNVRPIHCAASAGHADAVRLLLMRGAAVDAEDRLGDTALHYAAQAGHTEVAELLMEAGADVNARSRSGVTPLGVAWSQGQDSLAKLLAEKGGVE